MSDQQRIEASLDRLDSNVRWFIRGSAAELRRYSRAYRLLWRPGKNQAENGFKLGCLFVYNFSFVMAGFLIIRVFKGG